MKYEITVLHTSGRMEIGSLDDWPTNSQVEELLLPATPHTPKKPFLIHEWRSAHQPSRQGKDRLIPVLLWRNNPVRVWGVHPGALSPVLSVNEIASEITGRNENFPNTGMGNGGKVLGPVLIATILEMP